MTLSAAERDEVFASFMRQLTHAETSPYIKSILRTGVDDADGAMDANATAFNNALNATLRAAASPAQKNLLLALVCWKRAGKTLP